MYVLSTNPITQKLPPNFITVRFLRGRSIVTQLLQVYHELIQALAKGKEIDIAYLDFAKAFAKSLVVPC